MLRAAIFAAATFVALAVPGVVFAAPVVTADTTTGPVGTSIGLTATPCPAPAGAHSWTSLVNFAQGGNSQLSHANFVVAADGTWAGQFAVPPGAVPGPAQLIARCFDPSHATPTTVDYPPVNFTVTASTLGAHEEVGPVGTVFGLSPTICPASAGAQSWTALVNFAQGGNGQLSHANFVVAADGTWSGQFTIPTGAMPGHAQLVARCFDPSHAVLTTVEYDPVDFLVEQSTLGAALTSGPVGTSVALSPTICQAAAGAQSWTALVNFAQGGNSQVSHANFVVAADGSWSGQFRVPTEAVPGPAQLIARCFDPGHAIPTSVDYAPVDFTVTLSTLEASPNSGPVGTAVGLSPTICPAAAGAQSWTALVNFAQGSNSQVSFANFVVAADGSWSGQFTIPSGAVPGDAQLVARCFDPSHAVQTTVDYAPSNFLVTPVARPPFVLTSPVDNAVVNNPQVPFSGTGLVGATVQVCGPDGAGGVLVLDVTIDASGHFSGAVPVPTAGTTVLTFEERVAPGGFCQPRSVVLARVARRVRFVAATATPTPTPKPTLTPTPTPTPTASAGGDGGGGGGGGGGPNPGATPELDSLILFGTGIAGLAGLARLRFLAARRKQNGPRRKAG